MRRGRTQGPAWGRRTAPGCACPSSQWPGMWQPTTSGSDVSGTVQVDVETLAGRDHDPQAGMLGRHADRRRRAGWRIGGRGLGDLPCVLHRRVADDRLVDIKATVDHMQVHGLAGHDIEDRRVEHVVAGDEVQVTRRGAGAGHDRRGPSRGSRRAGGRGHEGRHEHPKSSDRHGASLWPAGLVSRLAPTLDTPKAAPHRSRTVTPG